jgi:molecular chaperone Hsp33
MTSRSRPHPAAAVEVVLADHLIRAIAWGGRVRVVAGDTTATVEELRRIHEPSAPTTAALGRLATGALLLATSLEKVTEREPMLTVEVDGGGPAGRLMATASPAGWVRAMVANPEATADPVVNGKLNVAGVVGTEGDLIVTRDIGIAQDIAFYLTESEQTPAAAVLGVYVDRDGRAGASGGFLVQLLPGVSDDEADTLTRQVRSFGAVTSHLIVGELPVDWITTVFRDDIEILEQTPARFLCGCSPDRVETALKLLGADEVRGLRDQHGETPAVLTCGFCHTRYEVTPERLGELLREIEAETPARRRGKRTHG